MRVSVKGRYALAAGIEVARQAKKGERVSALNIANTLGISKIYLEQIFAQPKKGKTSFSVSAVYTEKYMR